MDGETWQHYGEDLETNLQDLSERLKRGAYRVKPVRRAYVPKDDGRKRPIGVPVLEDKIVQRSAAEVIGGIFEADFKGFSYGFRPGRSQHNALDAVVVGIKRKKIGWILDADIRCFFDTIDHGWLVKFVEHRIADRRNACASTPGKSPVREIRPLGSVRGAPRKRRPYRDEARQLHVGKRLPGRALPVREP